MNVLQIALVLLIAVLMYYIFIDNITDNATEDVYDYIIVGGGTAGCVLANRLSSSNKAVLVIEAGDYPRGWTKLASAVPIAVPFLMGSSIDWSYWSTTQLVMKALKDNRSPIPAGKVFGGTTAINAMIYTKGDGFSEIEDSELESNYYDKSICQGGNSECMTLSKSSGLDELTNAFLQAGHGFERTEVSVFNGQRATVFDAFIRPVLQRKNLYRLTNTRVVKVIVTNETACALTTDTGRVISIRKGGEIILSSGSMATPKTLLASGIGPTQVLHRLGIDKIADLPVGENVQDHPFLGLYFTINQTFSLTTSKLFSPITIADYLMNRKGALAHASGLSGIGFLNMDGPEPVVLNQTDRRSREIELLSIGVGSIINKAMKDLSNFNGESWRAFTPPKYHLTEEGFLINVILLKPLSRGQIVVTDINEKASVNLNHLAEDQDMNKLVQAVLYTIDIIERNPAHQKMGTKVHLPKFKGCKNLKSRSRAGIECLIRHMSIGMYHITSSCRMGRNRSTSVVDLENKVHGIDALRVVDASALPNVPAAHPMADVMMIAERAADLIMKGIKNKSQENVGG